MKKHGPRVNRNGRIVHGFWFAKEVARRRRRGKAARKSRQRNYRLRKGLS